MAVLQRDMETSRNHIKSVAIAGFSVIALLMVSIAGIALYEMQRINERASELATHAQQRSAAINGMRGAVSLRIASLRLISVQKDPFARDEEKMHFLRQGQLFILNRERFERLATSVEEQAILARFNDALRDIRPNSVETLETLLTATDTDKLGETLQRAIASRESLLNALQSMLDNERARAAKLAEHNQRDYQHSYYLFLLITAMALILAAFTTYSIVSRTAESHQRLRHHESHDTLTNLLNRQGFENALAEILLQPAPFQAALLYLDLDQFKLVNETAGHHAGDDLLRQIAQRIQKEIRTSDIFSRLGGDEFGVILNDCPPNRVRKIANKLRRTVKRYQHDWENQQFEVGVSIGVITINDGNTSVAQLLAEADTACHLAKEQGRNQVYFVNDDDPELEKRSGEMQWVNQIKDALRNNRFILYHQPIVAAQPNSEIPMIEVLVRMIGTDGEIIPPGAFLPAAERFDLMTEIDKWVVRNTLAWMDQNLKRSDSLEVSINICAKSASNQDFQRYIMHLISRFNINPSSVCFEITETMAMNDFAGARSMIGALGELGVRFAIDDFGSGMASFEYLKNLDVQYLKIDGSFVRDMENDQVDCEIVKSMNKIGQVMGKLTIAEFVENDAIRRMLQQLGVNFVQGYGIARPRPLQEYGHARVCLGDIDTDSELADNISLPA